MLGLISGTVKRLEPEGALPVPHMGWSRLTRDRDDPLLEGVADGAYAYFVHGFVCPDGPADPGPRRLWRAGSGHGAIRQPLGLPVPPRTLGRGRSRNPQEFPEPAMLIYPAIDLKDGVCVRLMARPVRSGDSI